MPCFCPTFYIQSLIKGNGLVRPYLVQHSALKAVLKELALSHAVLSKILHPVPRQRNWPFHTLFCPTFCIKSCIKGSGLVTRCLVQHSAPKAMSKELVLSRSVLSKILHPKPYYRKWPCHTLSCPTGRKN